MISRTQNITIKAPKPIRIFKYKAKIRDLTEITSMMRQRIAKGFPLIFLTTLVLQKETTSPTAKIPQRMIESEAPQKLRP